MIVKDPKIGKILLTLVYIATFATMAYVVFQLFVQATCNTQDNVYVAERQQCYNNYLPDIPDTLTFCGERVPLENFDVRESLEQELIKTMYWHSTVFLYIKRANRYFPIMAPIIAQNNIHRDFLYLCVTESGMDHVISPAKAVGFWQIIETTAKEAGMEINTEVDERYNIEKSTEVACKLFRQAYNKFQNWTLAAASYNCGQARMQKVLNSQGATSYYDLRQNPETGRYVYRILAYKLILSNPERYGFIYRDSDLYPPIETRTIEVDTTINNLYEFARIHTGNYKMLKLLNPWLRDTKLTNSKRKKYNIKVLKNSNTRSTLYPQKNE